MARCWVNTPPRGFRRARGTWGPYRWAAEMVKQCGDTNHGTNWQMTAMMWRLIIFHHRTKINSPCRWLSISNNTITIHFIGSCLNSFTLPLATTTPWLPDCCGRQVHLKGSSRNWSTGSAVSIGAVSLPFMASCGMVRTYVEAKELCLGLSWWRLVKG